MSHQSTFSGQIPEIIVIDSDSEDEGGVGIIPSPVGEDYRDYIVLSSWSEGDEGENNENHGRDTENWTIDQYFDENDQFPHVSPYRPSPATSQEMSLSSLRRLIFGPDSPIPPNHPQVGNEGLVTPNGPGVGLTSTPIGHHRGARPEKPATQIDPETVTWTNAAPSRVENLKNSVKLDT